MKIVIFGNSGSGKTTLAKQLVQRHSLKHLDLDTIAWLDTVPPIRAPININQYKIDNFISTNESWVIEGCYSDLLELAISDCTEIYFLNPGIETCIENCKKRPWEPHKYVSPEAQRENLSMLLKWVKQYEERTDEFSLTSHREIFSCFKGKKTEIK